jgi:hypothetical protein
MLKSWKPNTRTQTTVTVTADWENPPGWTKAWSAAPIWRENPSTPRKRLRGIVAAKRNGMRLPQRLRNRSL